MLIQSLYYESLQISLHNYKLIMRFYFMFTYLCSTYFFFMFAIKQLLSQMLLAQSYNRKSELQLALFVKILQQMINHDEKSLNHIQAS